MKEYNNIEEIIKNWFKFDQNVGDLRVSIDRLSKSKVFDILRRVGVPRILKDGSDVNVMATQAAYSAGYQRAVNDMEFFEQTFNPEFQTQAAKALTPDFGGKEAALASGAITKEDLK